MRVRRDSKGRASIEEGEKAEQPDEHLALEVGELADSKRPAWFLPVREPGAHLHKNNANLYASRDASHEEAR